MFCCIWSLMWCMQLFCELDMEWTRWIWHVRWSLQTRFSSISVHFSSCILSSFSLINLSLYCTGSLICSWTCCRILSIQLHNATVNPLWIPTIAKFWPYHSRHKLINIPIQLQFSLLSGQPYCHLLYALILQLILHYLPLSFHATNIILITTLPHSLWDGMSRIHLMCLIYSN